VTNFSEMCNFIWSIADLLRGDYKQSEYGRVILPFTVLRRLDCVLKGTKDQVLREYEDLRRRGIKNVEPILTRITGYSFYNISKLDFESLLAAPNDIAFNLVSYIQGFSPRAKEIMDNFRFEEQIARLDQANLLYLVVSRFAEIDLHPDTISNRDMGYIFEELIRRFSEASNETAGEHYTPREVIRLMVNILFYQDEEILTKPGIVKTLYDPACGTGGMLSVATEYLHELNPRARLEVFGQEINAESYAICLADIMIKGQDPDNIKLGNTFTNDGLPSKRFDYMLCNPPFGVDWKKYADPVREEYEKLGHAGRFGAGLPRVSDGSLLFLQHMISKMNPENGGCRLAIIFNGSPLFTGDAGSGESEIRRWIFENDWLEAIIALPDQLFYNTGIATYIWVLTNRKSPERKGKIQLINAVDFYEKKKMRRSLGQKRNQLSPRHIDEITRIYGEFQENKYCKIFRNEEFGYQKITVERPLRLNFQASPERIERLWEQTAFANLAKSRKKGEEGLREIAEGERLQRVIIEALKGLDPTRLYKNREEFEKDLDRVLRQSDVKVTASVRKAILNALSERDETADICRDSKGNPEPDPELRDTENVPLTEDIYEYFEREVKPYVPDAWIDESKTKIGYEIPFTRYFYEYKPLRPLEEIEAEVKQINDEIQGLLREVFG